MLLTPYDDKGRSYKRVALENGLKLLVISDPDVLLSSVCVLNPKGSLSDPPDYQGMSHFLEHMLFLGSHKYPQEKHYREFISNNGGKCNAWTFWNYTYYHFDVDHSKFEEALDILSEQLADPLLNEDTAKREIWAVNSEHFANSASNNARYHSLFREAASTHSPFKKYLLGNLRTLDVVNSKFSDADLEKLNKLLDFDSETSDRSDALDPVKFSRMMKRLKEHYLSMFSADQMCAVILGNRPTTELLSIAKKTLSKIPIRTNEALNINWQIQPGPLEKTGTVIRFRPLTPWEFVSVVFYMRDTPDLLTKPSRFLCHLVANQGKCSLVNFLRETGLVHDFFAYHETGRGYFQSVEFRVTLTTKGHDQHEKVVKTLAAYLFWLKTKVLFKDPDLVSCFREWVLEKRTVALYAGGTGEGLEFCTEIAKNMAIYGWDNPEVLFANRISSFQNKPSHLLDLDHIDFDAALQELEVILKMMDGSQCISYFCSPLFTYDDPNPVTKFGQIFTQEIYGVKHTVENVGTKFEKLFQYSWDGYIDFAKYQEAVNTFELDVANQAMKPASSPPKDTESQKDSGIPKKTKKGIRFDITLDETDPFGLKSKIGFDIAKNSSLEDSQLVKPRPQLSDFMTDDYYMVKSTHGLFTSNFALPYSTYIYKNFVQDYLSYSPGTEKASHKKSELVVGVLARNLVSYYMQRNPLNKYYHVIKAYLFVPGVVVQSLKAMEHYAENLAKLVKKDGKKTDPDLVDISVIPQLNGIHVNIYGRLPALVLEKFGELQKAMRAMNSSGFVKLSNEDAVRVDLGKESPLSLAHHQLMVALNLYLDGWEGNLDCNFLRLAGTSYQITFSKVVLLFLGGFNPIDIREKSEQFRVAFCYQRNNYHLPVLTKHGLIPQGRRILTKATESDSRNSSLLMFFQTRFEPTFCEYYGVSCLPGMNDYATAKIYTLLMHHYLQVEFFQVLRSQHAVGYHVYSRIVFKEGLLGVGYFIQSSENCPAVLGQKTLEYISKESEKIIAALDSGSIRKALRSVFTKPHDRLYEYPEIFNRLHEIFYQNDALSETLRFPDYFDPEAVDVSVSGLTSVLKQFYLIKPSILEVHVVGPDHKESQQAKLAELMSVDRSSGHAPVEKVYSRAAHARADFQLSQSAGCRFFTDWDVRTDGMAK